MSTILSGPQPAGRPKIFTDNVFDFGVPVASSTDSGAGINVLNLRDWRGYTWWKPVTLPATVTVDCTNARPADYCMIYGHDLFSKGCTVEVRGSTDNFSASDVLIASFTPTSDTDAVTLIFAPALYRYWRLRITGSAAPSVAVMAIGQSITLPTFLPSGFDPTGRKLVGDTNRNAHGQVLGRVVEYEEWSQEVSITRVPWSWIRNTWIPLWKTIRQTPFGFSWSADNYPGETRLVIVENEFSTPHSTGLICDLRFTVSGVA